MTSVILERSSQCIRRQSPHSADQLERMHETDVYVRERDFECERERRHLGPLSYHFRRLDSLENGLRSIELV